MEKKLFKKSSQKGVYLSDKYYESKKLYKFRSIYDENNGNTIVMVDLDRATVYEAKEFYDYVDELIENDKTNLIIDMEKVYFIDSVFFGSLIKLLKRVDKKLGFLKLIIDHNSKPELLSVGSFDQIFEIYPNLFEALNKNKAS